MSRLRWLLVRALAFVGAVHVVDAAVRLVMWRYRGADR